MPSLLPHTAVPPSPESTTSTTPVKCEATTTNHRPESTLLPPSQSHTSTPTPPPLLPLYARKTPKTGKMVKERTLHRNAPREVVNFAPYEPLSHFHREKMLDMELYPCDGVVNYTRTIPFKAVKAISYGKAYRSGFDVFEYRFTAESVLGETKQWWVMWDHFNGLVRIHDIFECCKPGKIEPGNAVKERVNPGLQDICFNITGGNLHAQGYWVPFKCAKALAAKFAYRVRFALTIIFGEDFPSECLPPDHPEYGNYAIDRSIIAACQAESRRHQESEQRETVAQQAQEDHPHHPHHRSQHHHHHRYHQHQQSQHQQHQHQNQQQQQQQQQQHRHVGRYTPVLTTYGGPQTPEAEEPPRPRRFYDAVRGVYTPGPESSCSERGGGDRDSRSPKNTLSTNFNSGPGAHAGVCSSSYQTTVTDSSSYAPVMSRSTMGAKHQEFPTPSSSSVPRGTVDYIRPQHPQHPQQLTPPTHRNVAQPWLLPPLLHLVEEGTTTATGPSRATTPEYLASPVSPPGLGLGMGLGHLQQSLPNGPYPGPPAAKRRKIVRRVGLNPLKKRVKHGVELFRNPTNGARAVDSQIPPFVGAFTPRSMRDELRRQKNEDPARIQMIEAAGSLVTMALNDHEMKYTAAAHRTGNHNGRKRHYSAGF